MAEKMRSGMAMLIVGVVALGWWCGPVSGRVHVSLTSQIDNGGGVTAHCQSKDDDMGPHVLWKDQVYEWSFKPNIWMTTLFYCDVSWGDVKDFHFDAYVYMRDRNGCGSDCRWLFAPEGVYFFDHNEGSWVFRFPWRP